MATVEQYDRAPASIVRTCADLQELYGVGGGKTPKRGHRVWVVRDDYGRIAAFATAARSGRAVWTRNCVVAAWARGRKYQRLLLRARIAWAATTRARWVLTYTSADNWPSYRSLVAEGFRVWTGTDDEEAGGGAWVYWWRKLP
jgi:hypothetical protein